jgi:cytochrome c-type biogenesis protein CcmF
MRVLPIMTAEIGQFALILALVLSAVQALAPLAGAWRTDPVLMAVGRSAALLQLLFVGVAFVSLATCYVLNDFSVTLVAQHSNLSQPLIYRIGATWGSHEGSMLLWVLILAIYGAAVAIFGGTLRDTLQARVLAVQGIVGAAFLGFLIFTSNPFARLFPIPPDGAELNPVLQDPGLVFHPPVLYMGYVGLSMAFSFGVAALLEGRVDVGWARWVRPWVLTAWLFLTVGITMGSLWAYYTLGWGGWWFWDPVENASLMPWLLATALLHSSLVLERRGALVSWTILLSILAFSLSLVGTFLVRSGVLTSVHAFALDPRRGAYILGIIAAMTGLSLILFAWRAPGLKTGSLFAPLSREYAITINNLFLLAATATVFLGTFYPVFMDVLHGDKISVGSPYYRATFVPIFVLLFGLVTFGPMLNWKRDELRRLLGRVRWPAAIAGGVFLPAAVVFGVSHLLSVLALALGVWLISGALLVLARRWRLGELPLAESMGLARATPLAVIGLVIAHAGLGITTIGIASVSAWQTNKVLSMSPGQSVRLAGNTITMMAVKPIMGPNYEANQASFEVAGPFGARTLRSERRLYPASQTTTTEAGIGVGVLGNIYISVADQNPDGGLTVRMWNHPFVDWIWAGGLLMAFGGVVSLADRSIRVSRVERRVPGARVAGEPAVTPSPPVPEPVVAAAEAAS